MSIGEYPFSKRYGWIQDKYGASWQIIMVPESQELVAKPVLMYTQDQAGHAEEAATLYSQVFGSDSPNVMMRYSKDQSPEKEGTVAYGEFMIDGVRFGFMDSASDHKFKFNEGISIIVNCEDQAEIDKYFAALSAVPESEQCGWLKDKYGVSWQIVPANLSELLGGTDAKAKIEKFLQMKKIDISQLS
jgi:predicted 3-demethylubiquinone-9 3-methyltransferase (glyoxalase superfamily)